MLDLQALEAVDAPAHGRRQALNVPRGAADERAELVLREREESRVLLSAAERGKLHCRHTARRPPPGARAHAAREGG